MAECSLAYSGASKDDPIAPALPPKKLYHVFFSYSSNDYDWVMSVIRRLEDEPYRFKCCYDERDFTCGVPVMHNIVTAIQNSVRTVVVLTPDFVASDWCSYETRIVMEIDPNLRRRMLLPIMLRSCKIPQYLGRLTYIDATKENFWDRMVSELSSAQPVFELPPGLECTDARLHNGYILARQQPKFKDFEYHLNENVQPDALQTRGLNVPITHFRSAVRMLNAEQNMWTSAGFFKTITAIYFIVWFILVAFLLKFAGTRRESTPGDQPFLPGVIGKDGHCVFWILTAITIFLPVWVLIAIQCYQRRLDRVAKVTMEANRLLCTYNVLLYYCPDGQLVFLYYDLRPCLSDLGLTSGTATPSTDPATPQSSGNMHIQYGSITQESAGGPSNSESSQSPRMKRSPLHDTTVEERRHLVNDHLVKYLELRVEGKLPWPDTQKHTPQAVCLCQFVISKIRSNIV